MRSFDTSIIQQYANEPIILVKVWWAGSVYQYQEELLNVGSIEDVMTTNSLTGSCIITLDDSKGELLDIINNTDIHKVRAQVIQKFDTVEFVILDGVINTPIEWSEGSRQLTFNILTEIENRELGFSFEESQFPNLPNIISGGSVPLVFGTVLRVPALQLTETPRGVTAQGFALINEQLYRDESDRLLSASRFAYQQASFYFFAANGASLQASRYVDGIGPPDSPEDSEEQYNQWMSVYTQALQQSTDYLQQRNELFLKADQVILDLNEKKKYAINPVPIVSDNFPRGVDRIVEFSDDVRLLVRFEGNVMRIISDLNKAKLPYQSYFYRLVATPLSQSFEAAANQLTKFRWVDGGTTINIVNQEMWFVAAFGNCKVTGVFAKSQGLTIKVSEDLYRVEVREFGAIRLTTVILNQPLTTLRNAENQRIWDEDQIYCNVEGEVPGEYRSIINWVRMNFTDLDIDNVSFDSLPTKIMNFAITDRRTTMEFLEELCFQMRTALWINDRKMFFRYLPRRPTPVDTITLDDIIEDSLVVTCTDTEDLITKHTAEWIFEGTQENPNKVIVRHNVARYGVVDETYDYFAFNNSDDVTRSLAYWAIHKGTTWRILKFKCLINKLNLEAQDPVMIGFYVGEPVVGIVESAVYDPNSQEIDMVVWLPIRWGEMLEYKFAYPSDIVELYGEPNAPETRTGSPFQDSGSPEFLQQVVNVGTLTGGIFREFPQRIDDNAPTEDTSQGNTALTSTSVVYNRPMDIAGANDTEFIEVLPGEPLDTPDDLTGNADFGVILGQVEGNRYSVELIGGSKVTATQYLIHPDYKLMVGMPVVLVKKGEEWYMQAPVWGVENP